MAQVARKSDMNLTIVRIFDAPRDLVFRMWSEPHHMQRWSCPQGFTNTEGEMDFREGGRWRAVMRSPEGQDLRLAGIYREIVKPSRIVFTHAWFDEAGNPGSETLATVVLAEENGKTRMTFQQTGFDTAASRDGHESGWSESFSKLGEFIDVLKHSDREMMITRTIAAPVETVFAAFADAAHIGTWWGPKGFTTTIHEMDFRVGGVWRYTMHGPDGTDYPNYVTYTEIEPRQRIAYDHGSNPQHPSEFRAVITFTPEGGRTKVSLRMIVGAGERDYYVKFGAVEGGQQTLERLAAYIETTSQKKEKAMPGLKNQEFSISRVFDAPQGVVFAAFTDPERMKHWWGPKGFTVIHSKMDLRVGGTYHYALRGADGSIMWGKFVYREISAPERIVLINSFSDEAGGTMHHPMMPAWPLEMMSVFTFEDAGSGKTKFTVKWSPHTATEEERATFAAGHASMNQGWSGTFEQLAAYLAKRIKS